MKKIFILILSLFLIGTAKVAFSQNGTITIGLIATECDQIIVQWNSTFAFVGTGSNQWTQSTITLTWPSAQGSSVLGSITAIAPGFTGWQYNGSPTLVGSEYRQEIILLNGGYVQNIPVGITEIISIKLAGSGTANFTLANPNNNTNISSFNYGSGIWNGTLSPSTVTGVPLDDIVRWNGTRWCGGSSTTYFGEPSSADIGIDCFITGASGVLHQSNAQVRDLTVNASCNLTIAPNASLLVNRLSTINGVNGLNVDANATGTGSFISKTGTGTGLNYGGSASSNVKQYFTDNITSTNYHVHLVGPLVNDPSYQTSNGHLGVYLGAFNLVNTQTYAYIYNNQQGNPWVNVVPVTYPVPTTRGLALSTTTNASQTMSMTGKMVHGNITTANGNTVQNTGLNLISNPWPSGINLENFLTTNSYDGNTSINDAVYVWEGANNSNGGNYSAYTYTVGGTGGLTDGKLRIGQGFFVDYTGAGSISFLNNTHRVHANGILLKDDPANFLRIKAIGNEFSDELIVDFREEASSTFGRYDAEKWSSMYEEATEAWTYSTDNVALTINTLEPLGNQMVSVPLSFKCGTDGTYFVEASNVNSFEIGTEIYLEDLKLGGNWYNLMMNPVYEFTGSPDDAQARFILHFFGPTAIDDPDGGVAKKAIQIYSWQHEAYIVNRGPETVKEYIAYDMMGRELHRGTLPNNMVNKVTIGNVSAYYIVKVITKEGGVYTGKVYITK